MVKHVVKWVRRMIICITGKHLRSGEPYVCQDGEQILATKKMAKARNGLGGGQSRERSKK
jgi:hypothetical protein